VGAVGKSGLDRGLHDEGGGTRTHDLGIKSPLLYQLSYAPELDETSSHGIACTRFNDLLSCHRGGRTSPPAPATQSPRA
jgi:hypothetical protein